MSAIDVRRAGLLRSLTTLGLAVAALLGLLLLLETGRTKADDLVVNTVSPAVVTNDVERLLTIEGSGFADPPTVAVGSEVLADVGYVNSTRLTAALPAGFAAGVYDVAVTNAGGAVALLPDGLTVQNPAPAVTGIDPASAPNSMDTPVTISGQGFVPTPTVRLGTVGLADVAWISETQLTALVPWGLIAGSYDLSVSNPGPGAPTGTLADAFTVTQAIGVWTTGGPYGGNVHFLAVHPVLTRTVWASVGEFGLGRTTDGGDSWQKATLPTDDDVGDIGYATVPSDTLYVCSSRLYRTPDDGRTWQAASGPMGVTDFVQDPSDAQIGYMATFGQGVLRTADDGDHWQPRNVGLTELRVRALTIHPLTPTILLATTEGGLIFKTADSGLSWVTATQGLTPAQDSLFRLAVNPFNPDEVWAGTTRSDEWRIGRSLDFGGSWSMMDGPSDGSESVTAIAFHPSISGTVYIGAAHEVYRTEDGGERWTLLSDPEDPDLGRVMIDAIALDPATGEPAYLAGSGGFYRSPDGGATWVRAVEGIAGLLPTVLGVAPSDPARVYSLAMGDTYYSRNAGQTWALAPEAMGSMALAPDPHNSLVAYEVGAWSSARKTVDGGAHWTDLAAPGEGEGYVSAVAVHPVDSQVVFVGGGRDWPHFADNGGWVARSDDGGESWTRLAVGQAISEVTCIAIDPVLGNTVYIGTGAIHPYWADGGESGVFKSTDLGATWQPINEGLTSRGVHDLVIHPHDSQVLLAAINDARPGAVGIFRSEDGGASWVRSDTGLASSGVLKLAFDPLYPSTVYAATWEGLFRSSDGGHTWLRAAGPLGYATAFTVATAASEGRTLVYVGTAGGVTAGASAMDARARTLGPAAAAGRIAAGVYQITQVHRPVYLPLVQRN